MIFKVWFLDFTSKGISLRRTASGVTYYFIFIYLRVIYTNEFMGRMLDSPNLEQHIEHGTEIY